MTDKPVPSRAMAEKLVPAKKPPVRQVVHGN
jgi:hypothetical protein